MNKKITLATGDEVSYKVDHDEKFDGATLQGYVITTFGKAISKLGDPSIEHQKPVVWNILVGFVGGADKPLYGNSARYIMQVYLHDPSFNATTFNLHDAFEDYKDLPLKWCVSGSSPNVVKYAMTILDCKEKNSSFYHEN